MSIPSKTATNALMKQNAIAVVTSSVIPYAVHVPIAPPRVPYTLHLVVMV